MMSSDRYGWPWSRMRFATKRTVVRLARSRSSIRRSTRSSSGVKSPLETIASSTALCSICSAAQPVGDVALRCTVQAQSINESLVHQPVGDVEKDSWARPPVLLRHVDLCVLQRPGTHAVLQEKIRFLRDEVAELGPTPRVQVPVTRPHLAPHVRGRALEVQGTTPSGSARDRHPARSASPLPSRSVTAGRTRCNLSRYDAPFPRTAGRFGRRDSSGQSPSSRAST